MSSADTFQDDVIACLPHLRAFARLLSRNPTLAEDLVQETVLRALTYRNQFKMGTNLRGWLIVILRNRYFNEVRRTNRRRDVSSAALVENASINGGQEAHIELEEFKTHFATLPAHQREALLLVAINEFSYEEAAEMAGCPVGTMKSRVSRARLSLQNAMEGNAPAATAAPVPQRARTR
jgi:RNA polymerase sigma-70 factor (ECF subfamily)